MHVHTPYPVMRYALRGCAGDRAFSQTFSWDQQDVLILPSRFILQQMSGAVPHELSKVCSLVVYTLIMYDKDSSHYRAETILPWYKNPRPSHLSPNIACRDTMTICSVHTFPAILELKFSRALFSSESNVREDLLCYDLAVKDTATYHSVNMHTTCITNFHQQEATNWYLLLSVTLP